MSSLRQNDVVILIGAGASVDAGIPHSQRMIDKIEQLVNSDDKTWGPFKALFHYLKSSIHYADGLSGIYGSDVPFNIERLVNTLDELRQKDRHTLYPFVGAWNPKLLEVVGTDFSKTFQFRAEIVKKLRSEWINLANFSKASYFEGLLNFQRTYEYPLRVFSLNYDLCIEKACRDENVQRGFQDDRRWEWRLFDEAAGDSYPILLYKMHGSTDWFYDDTGSLTYSDSPQMIEDSNTALIFGTSYKLQYLDPFLFCAYEFRRWTLDQARVILCIGYGFADEHINGIIAQSLRQNGERRLVAVSPLSGKTETDKKIEVVKQLKLDSSEQLIIVDSAAKKFLESHLTIEFLVKLIPNDPELIATLDGKADTTKRGTKKTSNKKDSNGE